ncbi:hypothetical protein OC844_006799 [Tilletia horrida]|nr:hypothetical protein OC844_006799 [Tilletia horrida]
MSLEGGLDYERLMLAEELGEAYHQPSLWEINLGRIPPQPLYRFKLEGQEIWEDGVEGDMERIAAILRAARISADDE